MTLNAMMFLAFAMTVFLTGHYYVTTGSLSDIPSALFILTYNFVRSFVFAVFFAFIVNGLGL